MSREFKVNDIVTSWYDVNDKHELGDGTIGCIISMVGSKCTVLWNDNEKITHDLDESPLFEETHPTITLERFHKELKAWLLLEAEQEQKKQEEGAKFLREVVAKSKKKNPKFWEKESTKSLVFHANEIGLEKAIGILQKIHLGNQICYDINSEKYGKRHT